MTGGKMHNLNVAISNIKGKIKEKKLYTRDKKQFLKSSNGDLIFKKIDQSELNKVNKRIRKQVHLEQRKHRSIAFMLVFMFLLVVGHMVYEVNKTEKELISAKKEQYIQDNLPKYSYFIQDGDEWLKKGHFKNAIFQYRKALEMFPNDSLAKSKLLEIEAIH
ncbi:putative TPR_REGION domain-containing protein [Tenacibaculum sp. 190524A02b]|uniref:hypothetical protein n=2 Tax=Tenacibaculum vairaonense TaxID=3137860 RepID=UPI0032B1A541